uniref:Uncharacterized protein n=1 Tax=Timema bartmani TaxID=61472 RepID=A0A7R9I4P2_9NEOP|nr:unnamed protein product [Timema bartmani]
MSVLHSVIAQVVSAPCLEAQESSSHEKVPGRHSRRQDRSLLEILRSAAHHYNTNTSKQTQGKAKWNNIQDRKVK